MKQDDPKTIETVLRRMDKDCAIRSVLSVLGGKRKFAEQFAIECGIMATRTKTKAEDKLEDGTDVELDDLPEIKFDQEE